MTALFLVLTLAGFVSMFFLDREYKLAVLFVGTMLLTLVVFPFKGITAMMVLSVGFLLSEAKDYRQHWLRIRESALIPYLILVLVAYMLAVITSPHLHNINDLGYFTLSEVIVKQLALLYGFLALRKKGSLLPLLYASFGGLVLMTMAGISNYVSGTSLMVDELFQGGLSDYDFITTERFRVQATFLNPFDYGYMCVLLALLHIYGFQQKMERLPLFIAAQVCCLFGVISCNCRTVLFCYAVCLVMFALAMMRSRKQKIILLSATVGVALVLFFSIPSARKIMLSVFSIFDASSMVRGSSLGMRILQLTTVLYYIASMPYLIIGRGVHFFELDLGWENGSALAADSDLYGLEGIYLNLLLERGILGFVIYLAILAVVLVFIFRCRHLGRPLYALGISVFSLYFLFSFMTGELLSFAPAFYILGYVMANQTRRKKIVDREERREECRA